MSQLISSNTPIRTFEDHEESHEENREKGVRDVAVFPDKRRMITTSDDKTPRLWDLETGVLLKKMEGHNVEVLGLAVSQDGQIIASSDWGGGLIAWYGENGESITHWQPIKADDLSNLILSVDFSPDGTVLATCIDYTVKFWCTRTWQIQGEPINYGTSVINCLRYSPSGELLAIATDDNIQIYNPGTKECVASIKGHTAWNWSLGWTPDGTCLLSGGDDDDPTIREWDPLTWQQVGHPWEGHTDGINAIAIHPAGTLVASASQDEHVRLWRRSDQQILAIFQHSSRLTCVTFTVEGKHILSGGGGNNKISEWAVPKDANSKILVITTAHNACITGDLPTAEDLLAQEIHTDANNYTSYAHRSFIMARKHAWDHALEDAIKSISIQPSLTGQISKAIALCGKGLVWEAMVAFDIASVAANQDSTDLHFLHLIKAIALFNANQCKEATLLIKELAAVYPNTNTLARRAVEAYLRVELGTKALGDARHHEAADHFTAAINSGAFSSKNIKFIYDDFVVIFGWDLPSLLFTTHQKRCQAFLSAGKTDEALEAHKCMMDAIDDTAKARCLDWSNEFKEQCSALAAYDDRILGAEIPGQDQYGCDAEPNFFLGMQEHSRTSRPRPQSRIGRLNRLRLTMTRSEKNPPPAPPITPPPVATTTFKTHLRHLFTRLLHHATLPAVDVHFAQRLQRDAASGAPKDVDGELIPDEEYHGPPSLDPNMQQQHQVVAVQVDPGEHGGGWPCCC